MNADQSRPRLKTLALQVFPSIPAATGRSAGNNSNESDLFRLNTAFLMSQTLSALCLILVGPLQLHLQSKVDIFSGVCFYI